MYLFYKYKVTNLRISQKQSPAWLTRRWFVFSSVLPQTLSANCMDGAFLPNASWRDSGTVSLSSSNWSASSLSGIEPMMRGIWSFCLGSRTDSTVNSERYCVRLTLDRDLKVENIIILILSTLTVTVFKYGFIIIERNCKCNKWHGRSWKFYQVADRFSVALALLDNVRQENLKFEIVFSRI